MRPTSSSGTRRSALTLTSTTRPLSESYRERRYNLRRQIPTVPSLRPGTRPTRTCTTCCSSRPKVEHAPSSAALQARHSMRVGHGQRAWAALREKFDGCSREALRAEHANFNSARTSPGEVPNEFLYELDTRCERLNACDPPEGPTDRQFEDIIFQALQPEYKRIRTSHLKKPNFGIDDIRRIMSAIYVAYLARSSSTKGIAGDCGARGCYARGRRQPQRHHLPLLRTRGQFQGHVAPPRQARAAATTTRATERTAEPAAGRTASTRPAALR